MYRSVPQFLSQCVYHGYIERKSTDFLHDKLVFCLLLKLLLSMQCQTAFMFIPIGNFTLSLKQRIISVHWAGCIQRLTAV